jgi:hypothetical protein
VKLVRRLIALLVYAALLAPVSEHRMTAWVRAVEVASTSLDRTMRRRKSQLENDRFSRFLKLLQQAGQDREERTLRIRRA